MNPQKKENTLLETLDRVSYRRVSTVELDDPVYRLRYEAYRREEFIPFNSLGICTDDLDTEPNAMNFGVYIDAELVSSLRLHYVTAEHRHSPAAKVYPDIIEPMLDDGVTFIDPSRFTADYEASLAFPALPFLTLRLAVMASDYFSANYCLTTARPEHLAFYRRVFRAQPLAGLRTYPGLNFPITLYATSVDDTLQTLYRRYPTFRSTPEERQDLFDPNSGAGFTAFVPSTARSALDELEPATDMQPA